MTTYNTKTHNINGNILNYEVVKADYDGKQMAIDIYENGKHFYTKLNNSDISDILSHRAHSLPLEKRLIKDFAIKKRKSVKRKGKKGKKKTLKR